MGGRLLVFVVGTAAVFGAILWLTGQNGDESSDVTVPERVNEEPAPSTPSLDNYIARGVPDPDRVWTGSDYAAALRALEQIAGEDREALPRYRHPTTGRLFARMTAMENLGVLSDARIPVSDRIERALEIQPAVTDLMRLYIKSGTRQRRFGSELVELVAHMLAIAMLTTRLADEFMDGLPADDPKYRTRAQGLIKMRHGYTTMVLGLLITFREAHAYTVSERVRLARHAKSTLPELVAALPDPTQREIREQLRKLADETEDARLKAALTELHVAVTSWERPRDPGAVDPR